MQFSHNALALQARAVHVQLVRGAAFRPDPVVGCLQGRAAVYQQGLAAGYLLVREVVDRLARAAVFPQVRGAVFQQDPVVGCLRDRAAVFLPVQVVAARRVTLADGIGGTQTADFLAGCGNRLSGCG